MEFEDIPYPVKMYADRFKAEHERNTSEAFEALVRQSGVDEEANAALVAKIREEQKELEALRGTLGRWKFLRGFLILLAIIGGVGGTFYILPFFWKDCPLDCGISHLWGIVCIVVMVLSLVLIFAGVNARIKKFEEIVKAKQDALDQKIREAWEQMAPLNQLFQWDTLAGIVMKTIPIVAIDKYFSQRRMDQLCRYFRWIPGSTDTNSILCCQSGSINGNPWILAETLYQNWGTKTYYGSLEITWQEQVSYTDSNGRTRYRWETRHQTLTASVEKPLPLYGKEKFLVYGNEAAPDLVFSRGPTDLSSLGTGFFDSRKMKSAIEALWKKTRDLSNDFMIMDNEAFDACFNAVNRNHEQQFRLLFTPLAQQEMLTLLQDKEQGYGDDFTFKKEHMINILFSKHLNESDISGAPTQFWNYELAEIRKVFNACSNDFFHMFYFTLAPLFCIPVYQEYRNFEDVYKGVIDSGTASFFEYESFANAIDLKNFAPFDAITPSILKTDVIQHSGTASQIRVTAHAFRGEERVTYVSKYGGDGKWHDVPVHWIEYLPTIRKTGMGVCETGTSSQAEFNKISQQQEWRDFFTNWKAVAESIYFRRNLVAFVQRNN